MAARRRNGPVHIRQALITWHRRMASTAEHYARVFDEKDDKPEGFLRLARYHRRELEALEKKP